MKQVLLAIDLGTTSTKTMLVDRAGAIIARQRVPHCTSRPVDRAAEQDPNEWWANLQRAMRSLIGSLHENVDVAAIGVTGQMHGLVIHDQHGRPSHPTMIWQDQRSATTLSDLLDRLPADHLARASGMIAPGYQAASWHWLAATSPEIAGKATRVLLPKDEIIHRLTGEHVTDPSDAVSTGWFDLTTRSWDTRTVIAAGARVEVLPTIRPTGSIVGPLIPGAAAQLDLPSGIPVVIAGGDAAVGAFGAGATIPDMPLAMLSTGCQVLLPSDTCEGRQTWPSANPAGLPRWLKVTTTRKGGNVVSWARSALGDPSTDHAKAQQDDLFFLPYLDGDRSSELAPDAAGTFVGLRERHDRHDMAQAAIDGVALSLADALDRMGGRVGAESPLLVGGGGVRDGAWLGAIARALGRPIHVIVEPDVSAWGAARSAATTLGWVAPVQNPESWRPSLRMLYPEPSGVDHAASRLRRFQDMSRRIFGTGTGRES